MESLWHHRARHSRMVVRVAAGGWDLNVIPRICEHAGEVCSRVPQTWQVQLMGVIFMVMLVWYLVWDLTEREKD